MRKKCIVNVRVKRLVLQALRRDFERNESG